MDLDPDLKPDPQASNSSHYHEEPPSVVRAWLHAIFLTPYLILIFLRDALLALLPWTRPVKTWSLNQAFRMRVAKLLLHYWSLTRSADKNTLKPGKEGNRFEVVQPSPLLSSSKEEEDTDYYTGVLAPAATSEANGLVQSDPVKPGPVGMTWTPARPPKPRQLIRKDLVVALHFHGGGFVLGSGRDDDTGFMARCFLEHAGVTHVCAPQYRLSADPSTYGKFPAPQVQDALTAYLALVHDYGIPGSQIIVSGDSAGGNLALGLCRYISEFNSKTKKKKELLLPVPAGVALYSPWVDVPAALHMDMRMSPNYGTDYLNREFGVWGARSVYSGFPDDGDAEHASVEGYLSPLHHPFYLQSSHASNSDGGIPMFIHAGEREVLVDDARLFAQRYAEVKVGGGGKQGGSSAWRVKLVESKGCPHDILLVGDLVGFQKEAKEAAKWAGEFFAEVGVVPGNGGNSSKLNGYSKKR